MSAARLLLTTTAVAGLLIAACTGGGTATPINSAGAAGSPSTAATSAAASPSASVAESASASPSVASPPDAASSPASPPASGGLVIPGDQCTLATKEEISAAIGQTVAAAVPVSGGGCSYNDASGALLVGITVVGGDLGAQLYQGQKAVQGVQPVSGIGDEAIWSPNLTSLGIKKGNTFVMVGVALTLGDDTARQAIAKQVAAIVVPKI